MEITRVRIGNLCMVSEEEEFGKIWKFFPPSIKRIAKSFDLKIEGVKKIAAILTLRRLQVSRSCG